jgi:hypothetical protein
MILPITDKHTIYSCQLYGEEPCLVAVPVIQYDVDEGLPRCPLDEVESGGPCWKVIWPIEQPMTAAEIAEMEAEQ